MNFLRENNQVYQFVHDYVMAAITGQKQEMLQVDAETDQQAIIEANQEIPQDIVVRPQEIYEAPDEIPMDEVPV